MAKVTTQDSADKGIAEMRRLQQESQAVQLAAQQLSTATTNGGIVTNSITTNNATTAEHFKSVGNDMRSQARSN